MKPARFVGLPLAAALAFLISACGGGGSSGGGGTSSGGGGGGGGTPAPAADFDATPNPTTAGTPVAFSDTSLGAPTGWAWDFQDDGTVDDTTQNPSFAFMSAGTYTVRLTASNAGGNGSITKTVTVAAAPSGPVADIDADSNRDGSITAADDANEQTWNATQGAVFYFNQDDDDNNNSEDYADANSSGNDTQDLAPIILRQVSSPPAGGSAVISVSTAAQGRIRIFRNNGGTWTSVYSAGASFTVPLADLTAGDVQLGIEARDRMQVSWDGRVTLTFEIRNSGGSAVSTDAVIFRCAPPIFATNLWIAEELHLVSTGSNNAAFRTAMQGICTAGGITYREVPGTSYGNDRWIQDSSEPAVIQLPSPTGPRRVIDNVVQLARWRAVDDWCEDVLWGPDFDFFRRFTTNDDSHNYGGNLEVVPPYTGKPYGQIVYGGGTGVLVGTSTTVTSNMHLSYRQFFDACALQGPSFTITSEWLAVGHIDEFSMFIPAPNTARGFICVMASPTRAMNILQTMYNAGQGSTVLFAGRGSHQTTVTALWTNNALMQLNQETQLRIDQARNQIKAATGLTDADFVHIPCLYENVGSNYLAALNPGSVNLITLPSTNGTIYLALPDPEGPDIGGVDQFQLDINNQLAPYDTAGNPYSITYVDVFYSYHTLLGEAHCGSNTVRTPPNDDWWNK